MASNTLNPNVSCKLSEGEKKSAAARASFFSSSLAGVSPPIRRNVSRGKRSSNWSYVAAMLAIEDVTAFQQHQLVVIAEPF